MGWARDLSSTTTDLLNRLQNEDAHQLEYWELDPVVSLGKAAVTVATVDSDLSLQFPKLTPSMAKEATRLAVLHQRHHCSSLCKVSLFPGQECNKFFPRLPSLLCLVARTPLLNKEGQSMMANIYAIHVRLQRYLRGLSISPEHNQVASLLSLLKKVADPPEVLPSFRLYLGRCDLPLWATDAVPVQPMPAVWADTRGCGSPSGIPHVAVDTSSRKVHPQKICR